MSTRAVYSAASQALVLFGAPMEAVEIFHEDKMTNTEVVNKDIYFSYPCRRHSCSLVNFPAPCVNKMISHIEDVESKIQEHLKRFETTLEEWSRISSTKDMKEGWSLTPPVEEGKPEERGEKCPELKQEMETLLSEAIHLIKSLETDRAEAEEALRQQKSRKELINLKIDSWSIWRLQEIPLAVQREHEAYLRDIIELQWHFEHKAHQLKLLKGKKTEFEETNFKLQEDIEYMKEHTPLLISKRNRELETLRECYKKKFEVMELYRQVHGELEAAMEHCKIVKVNAQRVREEMERDIYYDEIKIQAYKKEFDKINNVYIYLCQSLSDLNISAEEQEDTVAEVLKETVTSTNELYALTKTLNDLKRVYEQLAWKKKTFENEYLQKLNDFYTMQKTWSIELSNIAKDFSDILAAYNQLMDENRKIELDIENVTDYITNSIKKKAELEAEIQSLIRMKQKHENYLKYIYKEGYHIGAIYHLIRFKTEEIEEQIAEVRRRYKGREDFLKKFIRGIVANGIAIQKRLLAIQDEQALEREALMKQKSMYTMILSQIERPLLQLEQDAVKVKTIYKEHFDILHDIIERRDKIKKNVERTKKQLRKRGKKTRNELMVAEGKQSLIFKEIESTKSKTFIYHTKIYQMDKDLEEKIKEKENIVKKIDILKDQLETIRYKKEHAQAVFEHLMNEKKVCKERIYEEEQKFHLLFTMRKKTLANIKKIQDLSLEENLRLAHEYLKLQSIFLAEKDDYFNKYDRLLSYDSSIRDKKQLCQLQKRIHKVWEKHFKLVVLYSEMRLAKFQRHSQESIQKILVVQEKSSNLMQHILDFFQTLTDNRCENDG
ncbi:PREDICTED: coiled-coil domain-containing protein 178 [Condylura cristata]|uniref:coiled-coil domain-containing protein 178 n=1 Tax=Condylura cristata TaxID=143302 RepID=UPI0003346B4A|nr:PREDICTED: coiled-coil domain-containing protein 178 [Condylura cristata]